MSPKPFWQRFFGVAAGVLLAACETLTAEPPPPPPPPMTAQAEQPRPPEVVPPPPRKPRPARKAPPAASAPSPEPNEPIALVGVSRQDLTNALGEPAERIDRNPGQAWVYRVNACTVEVLFLLDVVRNDLFSVDRKVTGTDGTPRGEQQCLQRIKAAHGS